jgi:hypothetical protein
MFFDDMENESEGSNFCGGVTHELMYSSGRLSNNFNLGFYQLASSGPSEHEITGKVSSAQWLGIHQFVIKGTNGVYDSSPNARGDKGLFNSVISSPFTIEITNPCLNAVLNPNGALQIPEAIKVPPRETLVTRELIGTKDSVSILYGNGFELCGTR